MDAHETLHSQAPKTIMTLTDRMTGERYHFEPAKLTMFSEKKASGCNWPSLVISDAIASVEIRFGKFDDVKAAFDAIEAARIGLPAKKDVAE